MNNRMKNRRKLVKLPKMEKEDNIILETMDTSPLISVEDEKLIQNFVDNNPNIFPKKWVFSRSNPLEGSGHESSTVEEVWIQTYSGRRFNPLNPVEDAIVIQDIAHALAMLCRFTGHVKNFYSVAQHSVLVSYLCDSEFALHGLLHDASEAYMQDLPRPLKRSGKFENYREYENILQKMIFKRFELSEEEPASVKIADTLILATEARDLMSPLHSDWKSPVEPLPMKIVPLGPAEAKNLFMKRFFELKNCPSLYDHYLHYNAIK